MKFNINIKKTFKINGREYHSLDEMPDDIRELFSKAQRQTTPRPDAQSPAIQANITVNSKKYASKDDMPPDIRDLYEKVMQTAKAGVPAAGVDAAGIAGAIVAGQTTQGHSEPVRDHRPLVFESSFSAKHMLAGAFVLALIALLYILMK